MKKLLLAALIATSVLAAGCYSVKVCAPSDSNVSLKAPAKNASFRQNQKNWFVLWGLVPLNERAVRKTIDDNNLTEVRTETKTTFIDWLISGVLGSVSVVANTTVIEGTSGN